MGPRTSRSVSMSWSVFPEMPPLPWGVRPQLSTFRGQSRARQLEASLIQNVDIQLIDPHIPPVLPPPFAVCNVLVAGASSGSIAQRRVGREESGYHLSAKTGKGPGALTEPRQISNQPLGSARESGPVLYFWGHRHGSPQCPSLWALKPKLSPLLVSQSPFIPPSAFHPPRVN